MEYVILVASLAIFSGMVLHDAYSRYQNRKKWRAHMKHRLDDS